MGDDAAFANSKGEKIGGSFFGQSSFARLTRVKQTSVVKITNLIHDKTDMKLFAPLGCGIQVHEASLEHDNLY